MYLEGYAILNFEDKNEDLSIEELEKECIFKNSKLKKKDIFNTPVIYDSRNIILRPFNSLYDLMQFLTRMINESEKDLVFRGHSNANYQLVSSLLRKKDGVETESNYYFDIIKSYPERFRDARYHLDYLKVMQHYEADTRILDISTNFLVPIYFAVEENDNKLGELIVFDKSKAKDNVKRLNSDTVEVLASLAALDYKLKKKIKKKVKLYSSFLGKNGVSVKLFNCDSDVKKLVHEVGQVRLNFNPEILPEHLSGVYFSDSTFDNERITNQVGEFIIHGLIEEKKLIEKLNTFRYRESDKKVIFLIDKSVKKDIRRDLKLLGYTYSSIHPSLENKIKDIYGR